MAERQQLTWLLKRFQELSVDELYDIMYIRQQVFIVEQNCPYSDLDKKDQQAWHLSGYIPTSSSGGELAAYARILAPGVSYSEPAIGRIVTAPKWRGHHFGIALMQEALRRAEQLFGKRDIRIGAQTYLIDWYGRFGFVPVGERYDEDGIEHVEMLRKGH
ncbi:MAG TPA: GNAT family N-acetyltransferase [Bacteroidetes bacterium]|nr:GNAT family N-acetyltransferase [Bacteroidota bacterium]